MRYHHGKIIKWYKCKYGFWIRIFGFGICINKKLTFLMPQWYYKKEEEDNGVL